MITLLGQTKIAMLLQLNISGNVAELDLLELLNLTSEDLVEAFHDTIEAKYDYLIKELELTKEEIDIE
jgi:hypothetical protein